MKTKIEAVFFDLDGTLLDTAPDLTAACNQILLQYQREPISPAEFRHWIHGGALMMICNSFQIKATHPEYPAIKSAFLSKYQEQLTQSTCLFSGIEKVLNYLERTQLPWGIVTNKHTHLSHPLINYFGWASRCCCIISGDTLSTVKPHPEPLLHACQLAKANPQHCVYIGDTPGDIEAARAAGMQSIAVSYGYLPKDSNPVEWGANAVALSPEDIILILNHEA